MKKTTTLSLLTLGFSSLVSLSLFGQAFTEGFEAGCPPSGWTIDNPDGLIGFAGTTSAFKSGTSSAFLDIYNATSAEKGQADALITGTLNLSTLTGTALTFYYAYQMYSDPATYTTADALSVYASTDGGATWNSIYSKSGNVLVTASATCDSTQGYVPAASEWVMETVDISTVATAASVQFKFEFMNDWENNFYIDDIKLTGSGGGGVNEIDISSYVTVMPNPSTGPVFVDLSKAGLGQTNIIVYNILGDVVDQTSMNVTSAKRVLLNLANQPNGTYFVKVNSEIGTATKKLILNK